MPQPKRQLIIAMSVTVLDIATGMWTAPSIWQVWAPNPWLWSVLLVIAGTAAFTLMDIWAQTLRYVARNSISLSAAELAIAPVTKVELEGMDV